jgi:glycosyltransferase involved in cell wall biosynthesis
MPPPDRGAPRRAAVLAHSAHAITRFRGGLIRELLARGCEVLAAAPGLTGSEHIAPPGAALTLHGLPDAGGDDGHAISALLEAWAPDVVIGSGRNIAQASVRAARQAQARHMTLMLNGRAVLQPTSGEKTAWLHNRLRSRRLGLAIRSADLVVVHNEADRAFLLANHMMEGDRECLSLPGSGIDLDLWPVTPLPPISPGLVFLMAAWPRENSGIDDYLAAATQVLARSPNACFILAGSTPERLQALGIAAGEASTGLHAGQITCVGPVRDVRPLIASSHVVVHLARGEGCPGIVIEAMASGRPAIVSDDPGSAQTVEDGVTGAVVPCSDVEALADAMLACLKRPDLIPRMARAARARAEATFDDRRIARTMLDRIGVA